MLRVRHDVGGHVQRAEYTTNSWVKASMTGQGNGGAWNDKEVQTGLRWGIVSQPQKGPPSLEQSHARMG